MTNSEPQIFDTQLAYKAWELRAAAEDVRLMECQSRLGSFLGAFLARRPHPNTGLLVTWPVIRIGPLGNPRSLYQWSREQAQ